MFQAIVGQPIEVVLSMTLIHCGVCSIPFGVPTHFDQRRREDGEGFLCPTGHRNAYKTGIDTPSVEEVPNPFLGKDSTLLARVLDYIKTKAVIAPVHYTVIARDLRANEHSVSSVLYTLSRKGQIANMGGRTFRTLL